MNSNYFNYFTEVEEYFSRQRGKSLLVSPMDWCLIELWRDSGIPLNVVLRGIQRSFETSQRTQKKPLSSLSYCNAAVLSAFEEYNRAMLGVESERDGSRDEFSKVEVIDYLESLEKQLRESLGEVFERMADRVLALRSEIIEGTEVNYQQLDRDLSQIGSILAHSLRKKMAKEEFKKLQKGVWKEISIYKGRLSKEMYVRLEESYLEKKIHTIYALPEFTLLGMV